MNAENTETTTKIELKPKVNIIANRWMTPDGTMLCSKNRWDYVEHTDANGNYYAVDGGNAYIKLVGDFNSLENYCVYDTDSISAIREAFEWGSYGKNGDEELHHILLKDLTEEHICAILRTQTKLPDWQKDVFNRELEYRQLQ